MTPGRELLTRHKLLLLVLTALASSVWHEIILVAALELLPVEFFLSLVAPVPPGTPCDYLPHRRIVVALANVEAENLCRLFGLDPAILVIEDLVELD